MPRFVILKHSTDQAVELRPTHWDLMFEADGQLRTWAVERFPWNDSDCVMAVELPAHRLVYLAYEGEIVGNRGFVERCDAGQYSLRANTRNEWNVEVKGHVLKGTIKLSHAESESTWQLDWVAT